MDLIQQRFLYILDAAPMMAWMSGPDARCTFCNKAWLNFRGRTLKQELGTGWTEGVHPDDLAQCIETYLTSFHARREFRMEYRLMRADGVYVRVVDTGVPWFPLEGEFAGYVGACGLQPEPVPELRTLEERISPRLTDREKQVMVLIAQGHSTKKLASILGISYKTADSHRTKIMEKLGIHETASLVRYAIRHGLVQP